MKKILLLILFLVFFISGCSEKNSSSHITFATWGSKSEIKTIERLIQKFENDNPDLKVDLIHIPENYFQKLHLLIASNLAPDVIFINNLNSENYIIANKLEPLGKYLDNSKTLKKNDFAEKSLATFSANGEIYAIPRDISEMVVYYNKDIFDRYKISYPKNDWSFDDFLNIAKTLTKDNDNDDKIDIFGFGFHENILFWLPFLFSNGGGILNSDKTVGMINNYSTINALQFYSDLRNKYHVAPKRDEQSSLTTSQLFLQGKVAMHLCGRWCSQTYKKNAGFSWGIAKFPNGKKGSIVPIDTSGWAISSASKHKKEAWRFIEFFASDYATTEMTKDGLIFPAKIKVANSPVFLDTLDAKVFIDALNSGMPTPVCPKYAEIIDLISEETEFAFNGSKQVLEIFDTELNKRVEHICRMD